MLVIAPRTEPRRAATAGSPAFTLEFIPTIGVEGLADAVELQAKAIPSNATVRIIFRPLIVNRLT
jgi:hypothetical protein